MTDSRRVEYMRLGEILPAPKNPKAHDSDGIARSIGHFPAAQDR